MTDDQTESDPAFVEYLSKKIEDNIAAQLGSPRLDVRDRPEIRKMIAECVEKAIGPFDDHVELNMSKGPKNTLLIELIPKTEIGEGILKRAGVIKMIPPINSITITTSVIE